MNKKVSIITGLLLAVGVGCSNSPPTRESSPATVTTTGIAGNRNLAVTVPRGPDEPVKVSIPMPTTTTTTTVVIVQPPQTIPSDLLFAFDSARLSEEAAPILAAVVSAVQGRIMSIQIDGYTDGDGSVTYNEALSVQRAEAVRDWFEAHGVSKGIITLAGFGESKPVAPNDTPENKAKNRRVEITLRVSR